MNDPSPSYSLRQREARLGLGFLAPWFIGLVLFKLVPIGAAFVFSFTDFYMMTPDQIHFVGLANYLELIGDPLAGANFFGSLTYFLFTVPLTLVVALGFALLFSSKRLKGKRFLRPLIFMPSIISATAIVFIAFGLADPRSGWINLLILQPLGLPPIADFWAFFISLIALWSIGPGFLIMLAALQNVSPEMYEAARVDGAGPLMRLFKISLPLISPSIFFSILINLTGAFGGTMLLDRGYLFNFSLSPMEGYINDIMFREFRLGYASALAWVMFGALMVLTLLLFRAAQRWVYFPEGSDDAQLD